MINLYFKRPFVFITDGLASMPDSIVCVSKTAIQFRTSVVAERSPQIEKTAVRFGYIVRIDLFFFVLRIKFSLWSKKH